MHITSMGLTSMGTQSNIHGGASLRKSQESFIVDVRLSSKYTSGVGFKVEKVYKMSIFI